MHVATYCLTSHYTSCFQYQLLAGAENEAGDQAASINRRRSIRIPSHHSFRFSEITGNDQIPGLREDDAWTVDLSNHGIRFTSRHPLNLETVIRFSLEADDTAAKVEGTGKVVWCDPIENTPLFNAAIAFNGHPDFVRMPHHRFLNHA